MDLRGGSLLWITLDGERLVRPSLQTSIQCDVLIVGSGITGALVSFCLAEQKLDVVVVDRRDIACGSTPASTALLQYDIDTPLVELRKKFGRQQADGVYRVSRKAVSDMAALMMRLGLECGLAEKSSLFLAHDDGDVALLEAEMQARREIGLEVEYLNRKSLARWFGIHRDGAILSRVAYQMDPWRFTKQLLVAAEKLGARIFGRTALIPMQGDDLLHETGEGHRIAARHVVWATGYEAPEQFAEIRDLCQLNSTYVVASRPVSRERLWPEASLLWETGKPYLYARTTAEGRVIIGGRDEPFADPGRRDALIRQKSGQLVDDFERLYSIGPLEVETAWAGTFAATEDGLPFIGQMGGHPCCHFALGYGGNGITFSLIAAELIRDDILGHRRPTGDLFSFDRLSANGADRSGRKKASDLF